MRCLGTPPERTSGQPVKQIMVFHGTSQNDWRSLILALTSVWKSCGKKRLSAGLTPRSEPLINRIEHKQQWHSHWLVEWFVALTTGIKSPLQFTEVLNGVASARFGCLTHFLLPGGQMVMSPSLVWITVAMVRPAFNPIASWSFHDVPPKPR